MTKEAKPLRRSGKKAPVEQVKFSPEDMEKAIQEFKAKPKEEKK